MRSIRAATTEEVTRSSGHWVFIDLGFAKDAKSCGLLVDDGDARTMTFSRLGAEIAAICSIGTGPINLLIEAPLSVAFGATGNPIGRSIELRDGQSRYWYVGLGCAVLVAATYLLRSIFELPLTGREIRLVEGLVSFKPRGVRSSHTADVEALRSVVWQQPGATGLVVAASELAMNPTDRLMSAFTVSGMDFGVPPVVIANSSTPSDSGAMP